MRDAIFLYDGDCAFCSSCARFVQRWIPTRARVEPWQFTDVEGLGLSAAECDEAVQWVDLDTASHRSAAAGPAAIAALLRTSTRRGTPLRGGGVSSVGWRTLGRLLGSRLGLRVAWPIYRWVSRNRHRMPGGTAACAMPTDRRASTSTTLGSDDRGA